MNSLISIESRQEVQDLFGAQDENLKLIEKELRVKITLRNEEIKISGTATNIKKATRLLEYLLAGIRTNSATVEINDLNYLIKNLIQNKPLVTVPKNLSSGVKSSKEKTIKPRSFGQNEYSLAISKYDIVFGIGPAGTGKTYLAMAAAVEALNKKEVRRIILTRPAIEAGESLGFLPGDMYEKISPYLRPLYDALYDMMDADRIEKYLETGIVEVAPLAYMRGRTLNDAFIILDEAQNCTAEQMKMFLTRLGFDSKAVITGDMTQSDLPNGKPIGLFQAKDLLSGIEGIKFIELTGADIVRHALVQKIIEAYDNANSKK